MDPYSPGARLLGMLFRTAHLLAMAVFVGGVWAGAPAGAVEPWRMATIGTGVLLLASEVSHDPRGWAWQASGLAVMAHVAALALLVVDGRVATGLAVAIGAMGSHAPKRVRKWRVWGAKAGEGGD